MGARIISTDGLLREVEMNVHSAGTQPAEHRYQQNYVQNDQPQRAPAFSSGASKPAPHTTAAPDPNLGNHFDKHA